MDFGIRVVATIAAAGCVLSLTATGAGADEKPPMPSQAQVEAAKAAADRKAGDVAAIQAALAVANSRLAAAAHEAELAAEAYNGALWKLQKAKEQTAAAHAEVAAARASVEEQRAGVAQLVTQSYFQGSELNGMKAFVAGEGPEQIMSRMNVLESASASMQARYDQYTALTALAEVAETNAEKAEKAQQELADQAAELRDEAAAAANTAQSAAAGIASQRRDLIEELAAAQQISVELAVKRQHGLEQVAQQQAADAAAQEAAQQAAQDAKDDAEDQKDEADQTNQELENLPEEGGWDDPGLPIPAGTSEGAAKAIRFARAQLGEPYVWAAAGPNSWDCSGLTMMAWRQGGVSLPHYSAAQYQQTKHLRVGQLRPGDLVFWGTSPNTIHHVALYIGSGQIIHAPRTGDVVKVADMYEWETPTFFGRP